MIKPYFYILYFKDIDKRYAGLRYANRHPAIEDILVHYKTSSQDVHQLLLQRHIPIVEEIVEFNTVEEAADYEFDFLSNCYFEDHWINRTAKHALRSKPSIGDLWI